MRIIAGEYGGRRFTGKLPKGVRPTMDAMKESIFNMLMNYIDLGDIQVADFFAGSGALGFEAISRGAVFCRFVEKNPKVAGQIKKAAQVFDIPKDRFAVTQADVVKILSTVDEKYDLIFADPPYHYNLLNQIISNIYENNKLNNNGIIVFEHDVNEKLLLPDEFELLRSKKFGSSVVEIVTYK